MKLPNLKVFLVWLFGFSLGAAGMAGFAGGLSIAALDAHIGPDVLQRETLYATALFLVIGVAAWVLYAPGFRDVVEGVLVTVGSAVGTFVAVLWGIIGAMLVGPKGMIDDSVAVFWVGLPTALASALFVLFVGALARLVGSLFFKRGSD